MKSNYNVELDISVTKVVSLNIIDFPFFETDAPIFINCHFERNCFKFASNSENCSIYIIASSTAFGKYLINEKKTFDQ